MVFAIYVTIKQIVRSFLPRSVIEVEMLPSWEIIPNPRLDPYGGRFYENSENQGEIIEDFKEQIGWEEE